MTEHLKEQEVARRVKDLRAKVISNPSMRPALASELLSLSRVLEKEDRYDEAVAAAREGIDTLSELFIDDPEAFKQEMYVLVTQYMHLCRHSSIAPDKAMLAPLAAVFGHELE